MMGPYWRSPRSYTDPKVLHQTFRSIAGTAPDRPWSITAASSALLMAGLRILRVIVGPYPYGHTCCTYPFLRTPESDQWPKKLRDLAGRARTVARIRSAEAGKSGDCDPAGRGVSERCS